MNLRLRVTNVVTSPRQIYIDSGKKRVLRGGRADRKDEDKDKDIDKEKAKRRMIKMMRIG